MPVLEIEELSVAFVQYGGRLSQTLVRPLEGVSLSLEKGEIMAVIGSSGSGKSLLAHAIMGILPKNARVEGVIRYQGELVDTRKHARLRGRELALVPQSVNFLDPLMQVGAQVRETAEGRDQTARQRSIFAGYRLDETVDRRYPFQLSGGMARRVLVATAAISEAKVIIADEPTPGMHEHDVRETQSLFRRLAGKGCSVLFITHDIGAAVEIADKVAVMYAGSVMETALAKNFSGDGESLRHPYSKALWKALPQNGFVPVPCAQPKPGALPAGCLFQAYCPQADSACAAARPDMRKLRGGYARCIHAT